MSDRTLLQTWQSLQANAASLERHHLRQLFADDPGRFDNLSVTALDFLYDFSRQRLTPDTLLLLLALARDCGLEERIQALKASKKDLFDKLIGGLGGDFDLSQHFTSLKSLVTLTAQSEAEEIQEPYTID